MVVPEGGRGQWRRTVVASMWWRIDRGEERKWENIRENGIEGIGGKRVLSFRLVKVAKLPVIENGQTSKVKSE
ncbi:hypothetical protein ACH5RR_036681 [Cinchona calisaya]|uniref:Uncharacterized protein n=1 Tax=Cinchona calisaya TaxID=153742 RepID=A0ABD2Y8N4_9GENT